MKEWLRKLIVPSYLMLCLLLGGSAQGIWFNMTLQIIAVGLIAWAAVSRSTEQLTRASKRLLGLVILSVLLIVLQLVPLPPEVWTRLPGRQAIETGYSILKQPLPWLPISINLYETLATGWTLLPPLAVLVGLISLRAYEESWLAGTLILGTFLGVLLGAVQTISGSEAQSFWYLYEVTNVGAVGFFANANHMGTLLLVTIPFAVALIASGNQTVSDRGRNHAMLSIGAGAFLLVLVGVVLNGSLAAVVLTLPTIAFSLLILPVGWRKGRLVVLAAALLTIVAVIAYTASPIRAELGRTDTTSFDSRLTMWQTSWAATTSSFPVGTGLGSFEQIYRLYEDYEDVDHIYINHAHNDYLELLLETGLPGLLLLGGGVLWWISQTVRIWRSALTSYFARAATIASAAILAHSIVDYPIRTAAIAAVFAMCLGVMAQGTKRHTISRHSELRPSRHIEIG